MPRMRLSQPPEAPLRRLRDLRFKIQQARLDGYLITNPVDQFYMTGFDGEDGAVLVLPDRVCLITDGRFTEAARAQAPWASPFVRTGSLSEAIGKLVRRHRLGSVGFDPAYATVAWLTAIKKACRSVRLRAVADLVGSLRIMKDETEVAAIVRAGQVAQDAFVHVVKRLRPGMTEREISAELLHQMLRRGASGSSFEIIVAEGPASSLPHARAGDRKIRVGSALLIDWGATVRHYRSDLTRVVFIRRIPPRFRRMYQSVLAAQAAGVEAIGPGVALCKVDAAARRVLREAGMDKAFVHGLGHGLGLDIHEPPRLSKKATGKLESGMVVTVEPGVYFPGLGGVRIEDDVVVTPEGCRVLTSLPKALDEMVV